MVLTRNKRILLASLSLFVAVIASVTAILDLLDRRILIIFIVIALALLVVFANLLIDRKRNLQIPLSLSRFAFAYDQPDWLSSEERDKLSDLAKAAFVLLLFEQTETGCWGKSYLPRHLEPGENLPSALGAITGTPFALMAISSYAERAESEKQSQSKTEVLLFESVYALLFATLTRLLRPNGTYFRRYKSAFPVKEEDPEKSRHAAGGCLIRLMYQRLAVPGSRVIDVRDRRTMEWLCGQTIELTYDLAVVSRLFLQVRYVDAIPVRLRLRMAWKRRKLFGSLLHEIQSAGASNIAGDSDLPSDSTNQWSTAWYILPLLTAPSVPQGLRSVLVDRLRQLLVARSLAASADDELLPTALHDSGPGTGKSVFATGVALLCWRIMEMHATDDKIATSQAHKTLHRLLASEADTIEAPLCNPEPSIILEGYLGWGAICLAAASVGINISLDDCSKAVKLTKQLSAETMSNCSLDQLERAYSKRINESRLFKPTLIRSVARAAAKLSVMYEPVQRAREEDCGARL